MSNYTKLQLTQIFRILTVFSQFLWNLTFISSDSHEKFSSVLLLSSVGRWYWRPRSRFSHTDLRSVNKMFITWQNKKAKEQNINNFICFPARAQAFSWLSSVTGLQSYRDKNDCSKSSFVQTSSMRKTKFFTQAKWKSLWLKQQFMKSGQKCNCIEVMPVCALIAQRSVLIQPCDLAIFDWSSQKTLMLNVQPNYLL